MIDDKKLYENFLKGDINSFEILVITHKDNLIYFISRYTGGDIYSAEDIAQDVFAYIFVYKEKYNFDYSFKTFLYTLGKNKAIDYIRKQSKLNIGAFDKDNEQVLSETESLEDKIIKDENNKLLFDSIKRLKPDYEKAIYLVDIEELSYKEAARILGKTLPQIKILIHRARKSLRLLMVKGVDKDEE